MKSSLLKFAVLGVLSASTMSVMAGFVTLPTSGSSAYVQCRTAGNFGSGTDNTVPPVGDSVCAVPNGIGSTLLFNSTPETGYTLQTANTTAISAFSETLGTLNERVFRNNGAGSCIYAKQVVMSASTTHDYNPQLAGNNKMEVNDYAFGGYTGAVSAGYAKASAATNSSTFRIGRTFTSVQMQADPSAPTTTVAAGFLVLPTTSATVGTEITGVGQTASPGTVTPAAGEQDAPFSENWVDFTTDVTAGIDEDGSTNPGSPSMYIKQDCANNTTSSVANSMKIRQTGQETQPWVVVTTSSRAPSSTIAP